jgi:hypothetical protein
VLVGRPRPTALVKDAQHDQTRAVRPTSSDRHPRVRRVGTRPTLSRPRLLTTLRATHGRTTQWSSRQIARTGAATRPASSFRKPGLTRRTTRMLQWGATPRGAPRSREASRHPAVLGRRSWVPGSTSVRSIPPRCGPDGARSRRPRGAIANHGRGSGTTPRCRPRRLQASGRGTRVTARVRGRYALCERAWGVPARGRLHTRTTSSCVASPLR